MYATDRDALLCDLAQTYGIYSFEALPVRTLAVLAAGLPLESRILRKLTGKRVDNDKLLLAMVVDRLSTLVWLQTKDARHGRNRPESLAARLTRADEEQEENGGAFEVFETPDAFMTARAIAIMKGGRHGN